MLKSIPRIADYCVIESSKAQFRCDRMEGIIFGDSFLLGLGEFVQDPKIKDEANLTGSIIEAIKLSGDQEMMKSPSPWTHQNFIDQFPAEPVSKAVSDGVYRFSDALENYLIDLSEKHQILKANLDLIELLGVSEETVQDAVEYLIVDYLPLLLNEWLLSAFYVDEKKLLFWDCVSDRFSAGGLPCGWLGPTTFSQGGNPDECMIMFHRCYGDRSREIIFHNLKEMWP